MIKINSPEYEKLIAPLYRFSRSFWIAVIALVGISAPGIVLYIRQLILGLGVTSLNRPAFWGIYLVNFIFLIGVSMAGTVISAVLHLLHIEWRRPITRIAEVLTVFGLMVAGLQIIIDMGRPDRILYTFFYGRLQAPLLGDIVSLTLYLLTAMLALYLQLLPDIALLRDTVPPTAPAWRKKFYTMLALKWRGNKEQWKRLEKTMTFISFIIIPIGISLHTVTSWLFSTTIQPGWKSTILGPYFIIGAIFSGMGLLFVAVTITRYYKKLNEYITEKFYDNLGWIFIVMSGAWFYFTLNEVLVITTEQETMEFPVIASKLWGEFAPAFWGMVGLMLAATWIMVAPKFLTEKVRRMPVFKPRLAWASAGTVAVLFVLAIMLPRAPFLAQLNTSSSATIIWAIIIVQLLILGLGITPWLKAHKIVSSVIAGIFVLVGMWLERWNILMPTVTHPRLMPYSTYVPTITEVTITISMFGIMALMFVLFFQFFPPISIWEVAEGRAIEDAQSEK